MKKYLYFSLFLILFFVTTGLHGQDIVLTIGDFVSFQDNNVRWSTSVCGGHLTIKFDKPGNYSVNYGNQIFKSSGTDSVFISYSPAKGYSQTNNITNQLGFKIGTLQHDVFPNDIKKVDFVEQGKNIESVFFDPCKSSEIPVFEIEYQLFSGDFVRLNPDLIKSNFDLNPFGVEVYVNDLKKYSGKFSDLNYVDLELKEGDEFYFLFDHFYGRSGDSVLCKINNDTLNFIRKTRTLIVNSQHGNCNQNCVKPEFEIDDFYTFCENDFATIEVNGLDNGKKYSIELIPENSASTGNSPFFSDTIFLFNDIGRFFVTVTDEDGCSSDRQAIDVVETTFPDFEIKANSHKICSDSVSIYYYSLVNNLTRIFRIGDEIIGEDIDSIRFFPSGQQKFNSSIYMKLDVLKDGCVKTDSMRFDLGKFPDYTWANGNDFCENEIFLDKPNQFISWETTNGTIQQKNDSVFLIIPSGVDQVVLTNSLLDFSQNCPSKDTSITLNIHSTFVFPEISDKSVCIDSAVNIKYRISNIINQQTFFSWKTGDFSTFNKDEILVSSIDINKGFLDVELLAFENSNCESKTNFKIFFSKKPFLKIVLQDSIVCGNQVSLEAEVSDQGAFKWVGTSNEFSPSTDDRKVIFVNNLDSNMRTIRLRSISDGICPLQFITQNIYFNQSIKVEAGEDKTTCTGSEIVLRGNNSVFYTWNNDVIDGQPFIANQTKEYIVEGVDSNGCISKDSLWVFVENRNVAYSIPELNCVKNKSEATNLDLKIVGVDSTVVSIEADRVVLEIYDKGCVTDTVLDVMVCPYVPKSFSPNGDGIYEKLFVGMIESQIEFIEMKIFNKWGMEVFHTNSIDEFWDGKYSGNDQAIGGYVYGLTVRFSNGKTQVFNGEVNLLRD